MRVINYAMALKNQDFDEFDTKNSGDRVDNSFLEVYESPKLKFCLGDKLKFHFLKSENVR